MEERNRHYTGILRAFTSAAKVGWTALKFQMSLRNQSVLKHYSLPQKPCTVSHFTTDGISSELYPDDAPTNFRPVSCIGDGNCFFRSLSQQIFGHENNHVECRTRVIYELVTRDKFYISDDNLKLMSASSARNLSNLAEYVVYTSATTISGSNLAVTYQQEVLKSVNIGVYSSLLHLYAASNCFQRRLISIYPQRENVAVNRGVMHQTLTPVSGTFDEALDLRVMWTHTTNASRSQWSPNHFVSCVLCHGNEEEQSCDVTDQTDDSKKPREDYEMSDESNKVSDDKPAHSTNEPSATEPESKKSKSSMEIDVYDVGDIVTGKVKLSALSDSEKQKYLKEHFTPGPDYDVIKQVKLRRGQNRSTTLVFQRSWLDKYKWLVYSPSLKGGLCKMCILFPQYQKGDKHKAVNAFIKTPMTNLSKALGKEGFLETHHNSLYHKQAVEAVTDFLELQKAPEKSLPYKISRLKQELYDDNCHILECITEAIVCCGRQGLSLRGHRDDSTSQDSNKGNFLAILSVIANHDPKLKKHLEFGMKNAKYTSKTVQNELVNILADYIRNDVVCQLQKDDSVFSIIADEVTEEYANAELLALCLRYVDIRDMQIKETFFDYVELERTTGEHISNAILKSLRGNGVDIMRCRGQSYDGAACMSSEAVGVQGRIKEKCPKAMYTHCQSHVLNLSIAASCKLPALRNMMDSINQVFLFFDKSPKRQRLFERVLQLDETRQSKKTRLLGFCKTRWVERHTCFEVFSEMYTYVCTALEAIIDATKYDDVYREENWNFDRETRTKANGLSKVLKDSTHIVAFVAAKNALDTVRPLASKLQKRDLDIFCAYRMIDERKAMAQELRNSVDDISETWIKEAKQIAEEVGTEIKTPRVTKRMTHRDNPQSSSAEMYYKRTIIIPFIDHLNTELHQRFQPDNRAGADLLSLLPEVIVDVDDLESLKSKLMFWEDDLPMPVALSSELREWKAYWGKHSVRPDTIIGCFVSADADVYPNIRKLLRVAATLPITSVEAERTFSSLRQIKTHLRSTMNQERLAGLTLLKMQTCDLDLKQIVQLYIQKHRRRLFQGCILYQ